MPGRNWAADSRRKARNRVINERALASMDPSSQVWIPEEDEVLDSRPRCLICEAPVSPDGDQAHQLSSGSWVHSSCIKTEQELYDLPITITRPDDGQVRIYEIEVEYTRYLRVQVIAKPGDNVRALIGTAEYVEHDISDVSVVVTEGAE